jgi:hypothetical protein
MINIDLLTFKLSVGKHKNPTVGMCFMEAVAWMANERHSDRPKCVCPVLGNYGLILNDAMTTRERKALNPLILKIIGTRSKKHEEMRAAYLLRETIVRVIASAFLGTEWNEIGQMLCAIPPGTPRQEILVELQAILTYLKPKRDAAVRASIDATTAHMNVFAFANTAENIAASRQELIKTRTLSNAIKTAFQILDAALESLVAFWGVPKSTAEIVSTARDGDELSKDPKKYRARWRRECVKILSEAIELGPFNIDEFYQTERVEKYRELVAPGD